MNSARRGKRPSRGSRGGGRGGSAYVAERSADAHTVSNGFNVPNGMDSSSHSFDASWLIQMCGSEEMALALIQIFHRYQSPDDVHFQDSLFSLLGESKFEIIPIIVENFQKIKANTKELSFLAISPSRPVVSSQHASKPSFSMGLPSNVPSVSTGVTVTSEAHKQQLKNQRKLAKKAKKGKLQDTTVESKEFTVDDDFKLAPSEYKEKESRLNEELENFDAFANSEYAPVREFSGFQNKSVLPSNALRRGWTLDGKRCAEIVEIPAPRKYEAAQKELVEVKDAFDELGQVAFRGMHTLNALQSKCYIPAYHSNENLLVCAPTGAGKTNVALMTVLREIKNNTHEGSIQKDKFKIIYVAPMKALAQEIVAKFSERLNPLGIVVKELTGDMQLTVKEIEETQIIVTTPEKWDVITRKSGSGDGSLSSSVRLLIIDEVHLLHEDRGAVIETIVARTLRQVETSQSMIRIVGLSATLPNYQDVADFLRVNTSGLLVFDGSHRPVPLQQVYIGVTDPNQTRRNKIMTKICFENVQRSVHNGHQVMVFVHSRKDTVRTAEDLIEFGLNCRPEVLERRREEMHSKNTSSDKKLKYDGHSQKLEAALARMRKSGNQELKKLFENGLGIHHAGMVRQDRTLVENLFSQGVIRVLFCTATLAWGVNLPAHTVIIKGTQIYDTARGGWVDLGMLDVMQIFGRAGRPQFDTSGEGIIITSGEKLPTYLSLLTHQLPIESQFITSLPDNLNAEIILGTVTNLKEALAWLGYTYLNIRLGKSPQKYGVAFTELGQDPTLFSFRKKMITEAAKKLVACKMMRFDPKSGNFFPTDLGRISSHFYIHHETILTYNERLHPHMTDEEMFNVLSLSKEFDQIQPREDEQKELNELLQQQCFVDVMGGPVTNVGKTNILMQAYLSRARLTTPSLISDSYYIVQNIGRICRAVFQMCLKLGWTGMAARMLTICRMFEHRIWNFETPLRQLHQMKAELSMKLEQKQISLENLLDMEPSEVGAIIKHERLGLQVYKLARRIPRLEMRATVRPITRSVLMIKVLLTPSFDWSDAIHGKNQPFIIWVEDPQSEYIYHQEEFVLTKKDYKKEVVSIEFAIPIQEPLPTQYMVRSFSEFWLGGDTMSEISFRHLILPEIHPPTTELLDLAPLPVSALQNPAYEKLYLRSFTYFNPVQTQVFHVAYHTDHNILCGAPTGSGKTVVAELAMLRLFNEYPSKKVVYVAPLKALARQRIEGWSSTFGKLLGKVVVELTGDVTPDILILRKAHILITTPEKWDGVSRSWRSETRTYVQQVGLVVIDEIHLLGQDRGPVLEVIVSRMRFISSQTNFNCRIVGLSTALSNATDLATWLGIDRIGFFNFSPSVRPVPLAVHISGFSGRHYCPRMATMNKPAYASILTYSPEKPVLIFVSSRRQTRLTALDMIFYAASDANSRRFSKLSDEESETIRAVVHDSNLKHTLEFGIGMHHAGLRDSDRKLVESLFLHGKIQVLVCTSTLAWGVNLPAHLVIIKGTEYFDAKQSRYVDFPITDVLQMMGRAGRPQFDNEGRACIFVHEPKKHFYRKFLYDPFPVESSLLDVLHDHINAEIASGTIEKVADTIEYLTWTFFFRRLLRNPSFYMHQSISEHVGDEEKGKKELDADNQDVHEFLLSVIQDVIFELQESGCIAYNQQDDLIIPTNLGRISSYYYLSHLTLRMFDSKVHVNLDLPEILQILCDSHEYSELPVRHNEDKLNEEMLQLMEWKLDPRLVDDPHTKANILFQARFSRLPLPISDYYTDTKSVLDQAVRIMHALVDVLADRGYLLSTIRCVNLLQMIIQGFWITESSLINIPHISPKVLSRLWYSHSIESLPDLLWLNYSNRDKFVKTLEQCGLRKSQIDDCSKVLNSLPLIELKRIDCPIKAELGLDVEVTFSFERVNRRTKTSAAYAPRWSKVFDEQWWLAIGFKQLNELFGLRKVRVPRNGVGKASLTIAPPEIPGAHVFTAYLVSECYIGLDQEFDFQIEVVEALV